MTITNIRIFPNTKTPESNLKATATVVLNDAIILQGIRIRSKADDPSEVGVAYPVRQLRNGEWRRCFYPISDEFKEYFDGAVLDAYEAQKNSDGTDTAKNEAGEMVPFEVSRIAFYPSSNSESRTRASVVMELDGELRMHGMTLVNRDDGSMWLGMARRLLPRKEQYVEVFHPVSREARDFLTEKVISSYEESVREDPAAE